jgi:hypothetical protein
MIELSNLEKAFWAVKSDQCCRTLLTSITNVNEWHEGDFLLSAAVNVYLKKPTASLQNVKLLLDLGANPLCGNWSRDGVYLCYLNSFITAHLSMSYYNCKCLEMAAMYDKLELVMLLACCPQMNALHIQAALKMAAPKSREYLLAVLEQCNQVKKLASANAPTRYYHRPVAKLLLNTTPLAPILTLKGLEDNSLEELASLYTIFRRSMHTIRVVFFNKHSTAALLPVEMMRLVASYVVNLSPLQSTNLRCFGKILECGFQAETWFSVPEGFRRISPTKPQARW